MIAGYRFTYKVCGVCNGIGAVSYKVQCGSCKGVGHVKCVSAVQGNK